MLFIVTIKPCGTCQEVSLTHFNTNDLYVVAGLQSNQNFECIMPDAYVMTIRNSSYSISVYGMLHGQEKEINQYELPPPLDKGIFYGTLILVNNCKDGVSNLRLLEWSHVYDEQIGGIEDLADDSEFDSGSNDEDDSDYDPDEDDSEELDPDEDDSDYDPDEDDSDYDPDEDDSDYDPDEDDSEELDPDEDDSNDYEDDQR
jgi:hypothetical protein